MCFKYLFEERTLEVLGQEFDLEVLSVSQKVMSSILH